MEALGRLTLRGAVFAGLWWALTDGRVESWVLGVPVVLAATFTSAVLGRGPSWSLAGWLRFLPFFVWRSLKGGVDVAMRAFRPSLPIDPGLIDYRLRLPPGRAAVFLAGVASLLPGTLAAGLDGRRLRLHVLDRQRDVRGEIAGLERRVAVLFRVPLGDQRPAE